MTGFKTTESRPRWTCMSQYTWQEAPSINLVFTFEHPLFELQWYLWTTCSNINTLRTGEADLRF